MNIHKYFHTECEREKACQHPSMGKKRHICLNITNIITNKLCIFTTDSMKYFKHFYSFNIFKDQSLSAMLAGRLGLSSTRVSN
jgi:hypothetical protein